MKAVSTMLGNLEFFLNVLRIPLFFFFPSLPWQQYGEQLRKDLDEN